MFKQVNKNKQTNKHIPVKNIFNSPFPSTDSEKEQQPTGYDNVNN